MPRHKKKKRADAAGGSAKRTDWLVGDLVVAKLRGHRPWPAQIQKPEDYGYTPRAHRIFVTFYGTEETCFCSYNKITPFTPAVRKGLAEQLQKINTNPELERAIKEIFAADDEHKLSLKSHGNLPKEDDVVVEKSEDESPTEVTRKRARGIEEAPATDVNAEECRPVKHEKSVSTMAVEQVQKLPRKVRIKVSSQSSDSANQGIAGALPSSDKASVSSLQSDVSLHPSEALAGLKSGDSPSTSKPDDSAVNCSNSCAVLKESCEDAEDGEAADAAIRVASENGDEAAPEKMEVDDPVGEEGLKTGDDEVEQIKNVGVGKSVASMTVPDESFAVDIESVSGDDPASKAEDSEVLLNQLHGSETIVSKVSDDEVHVSNGLDTSTALQETGSDMGKEDEVDTISVQETVSGIGKEDDSGIGKEDEAKVSRVLEDMDSSRADKEVACSVVKEDPIVEELHSLGASKQEQVPEEVTIPSANRQEQVPEEVNIPRTNKVSEELDSAIALKMQTSQAGALEDEVKQAARESDSFSAIKPQSSQVALEDELKQIAEELDGCSAWKEQPAVGFKGDDVSNVPVDYSNDQNEQTLPVAEDVEIGHDEMELDNSTTLKGQICLEVKEDDVSGVAERLDTSKLQQEPVSVVPMEVEVSVVTKLLDSSIAKLEHESRVAKRVEVCDSRSGHLEPVLPVEMEVDVGHLSKEPDSLLTEQQQISTVIEEAEVCPDLVGSIASNMEILVTDSGLVSKELEVSIVEKMNPTEVGLVSKEMHASGSWRVEQPVSEIGGLVSTELDVSSAGKAEPSLTKIGLESDVSSAQKEETSLTEGCLVSRDLEIPGAQEEALKEDISVTEVGLVSRDLEVSSAQVEAQKEEAQKEEAQKEEAQEEAQKEEAQKEEAQEEAQEEVQKEETYVTEVGLVSRDLEISSAQEEVQTQEISMMEVDLVSRDLEVSSAQEEPPVTEVSLVSEKLDVSFAQEEASVTAVAQVSDEAEISVAHDELPVARAQDVEISVAHDELPVGRAQDVEISVGHDELPVGRAQDVEISVAHDELPVGRAQDVEISVAHDELGRAQDVEIPVAHDQLPLGRVQDVEVCQVSQESEYPSARAPVENVSPDVKTEIGVVKDSEPLANTASGSKVNGEAGASHDETDAEMKLVSPSTISAPAVEDVCKAVQEEIPRQEVSPSTVPAAAGEEDVGKAVQEEISQQESEKKQDAVNPSQVPDPPVQF